MQLSVTLILLNNRTYFGVFRGSGRGRNAKIATNALSSL